MGRRAHCGRREERPPGPGRRPPGSDRCQGTEQPSSSFKASSLVLNNAYS